MNLKKALVGGAAALIMAAAAQADVTIDITGSTAFRTSTVRAIIAGFADGTGLTDLASNATAGTVAGYEGAGQSIFRGGFSGISGVTTVRCSWNGSVEGINAIVNGGQTFLTTGAFTAGTSWAGPASTSNRFNATTPTVVITPKFAMSDVFPTSSPYNVGSVVDTVVAVVPFVPMANASAPAGFNNLTSQSFRALWSVGSQPLRYFFSTGSATQRVYATGRNDFSGTRTTYLAETGYGISLPVHQYKVTSASGVASEVRAWPTVAQGGVAGEASGVWNGDISDNGGYSSGGNVTTAMATTSGAVTVKNAAGTTLSTGTSVVICTVIGLNDARNAIVGQANPAKVLGYNGVTLDVSTLPLLSAEAAKVQNGSYTMWGYEHFLSNGALSDDENTFSLYLAGNGTGFDVDAITGNAGIPLGGMNVGRSNDGALVAP